MLRLIGQDETVPLEIDGTTFTVRKMSHGEIEYLRRRHSTRGRLDEHAFALDFWPRALVGWENLCDAKGSPVPFSATARAKWRNPASGIEEDVPLAFAVAQWLGPDLADTLVGVAKRSERLHHEALGNSSPSSASGMPGTASSQTPSKGSSSDRPQESQASTSTPSSTP